MPEFSSLPDPSALRAAISSGDPTRAMPALAGLREFPEDQTEAVVVPLLILGSEQEAFLVRSLSCSGLGVRRSEAGWAVLCRLLREDEDANVRAEAANALASYGVARSWPLLRDSFSADHAWLVRCSILAALAEQPAMEPGWLMALAREAIADADGTVRVGGTEILGRLVREQGGAATDAPVITAEARSLLQRLQQDGDHRVVAAALNGLQS
ncbi:phycobiliprotein lyase or activator/ similar to CotB [Synechococcus sp. WH 8101]|uniref:HEAT repeat domain-containing protein n=1 Tax=Synechococcus sp. WH 8101 TaxID=59932 RepID=UPI001023438A|nr:HEAT repeat domain-containing protein [Synechococcus sp. WH 8101]QNI43963.1 phycobiliprotein lyase or activator/ similar to CotB [Synechococcus sp. WH 8101]